MNPHVDHIMAMQPNPGHRINVSPGEQMGPRRGLACCIVIRRLSAEVANGRRTMAAVFV